MLIPSRKHDPRMTRTANKVLRENRFIPSVLHPQYPVNSARLQQRTKPPIEINNVIIAPMSHGWDTGNAKCVNFSGRSQGELNQKNAPVRGLNWVAVMGY